LLHLLATLLCPLANHIPHLLMRLHFLLINVAGLPIRFLSEVLPYGTGRLFVTAAVRIVLFLSRNPAGCKAKN
jgi:hypothetical protein